MEHPAVDVRQIKDEMTLEEIQNKIADLYKRLGFALRMGNQPLVNQINMVLEAYQRAQREILTEMFSEDGEGTDRGLDGSIDIS